MADQLANIKCKSILYRPTQKQAMNSEKSIKNSQKQIIDLSEQKIRQSMKQQQQLENKADCKRQRKLVTWSQQQDRLLFQKYDSIGSKWVQMAEYFPTKNDNDLKNRFYACLRRVLKHFNKKQMQKYRKKHKHKKSVTLESLLTILEVGRFTETNLDLRFLQVQKNLQQILEIRKLIIGLALKSQEKVCDQQTGELITKIFNVKYSLKFINNRRIKNSAKRTTQFQKINTIQSAAKQVQELQAQNDNKSLQEKIQTQQFMLNSKSCLSQVSSQHIIRNKSLIESFEDLFDPFVVQKQKIDIFNLFI